MLRHWEENGPPVYISVASYLGLTNPKKSSTPTTPKTDEGNLGNLEELVARFSSSGGIF